MHAIAVYLDGSDAPDEAEDGTPLLDDDFLILVNGWREPVTFTLPPVRETTQTWFVELDSYDPAVSAAREFPRHTGDQVVARARSLTVLRAPQSGERRNRLARTVPCSAWQVGPRLAGKRDRGPPQLMRLVRAPALVRPDKVDYTCGPPSVAVSILEDQTQSAGRPSGPLAAAQRDRGEQAGHDDEAGRQVERVVQAVAERRVGRADHLADDRAVGGVVGGRLAGLDERDDRRLEAEDRGLLADRDVQRLQVRRSGTS